MSHKVVCTHTGKKLGEISIQGARDIVCGKRMELHGTHTHTHTHHF